ncbi:MULTISPECIES: NAD-dependent epimerase/dehydratase family protein [unclassified Cupriavidus]|uniref:NAD-dependent epimerase/dehydratase family protein n=1 Tax=unclassified Cupriavidus TaxID=2640874 RepID=UPI001BFFEE01|nr:MULTISPECIES: NAD-dependent epimerase/dehydratase family protein [unclassified Cupriavidus]MCA3187123.1 NAD-dependent epimerase/dehydratase family protein [Cupriavidus sp.]MCA3192843.1 NAD-dependent epimerase/dehydratase family protein [Cupriavidus sp.]MCA3195044.1 NAD-dependent epimerase/dehydratase family protein [Cupriavidus sp.]MCA3204014.1 NAD-dependent epimerase/dehydratase family protein [Cupriavidus sp.]QWE93856.1 NAD-dependent epimerase/dehydratase family protein [Cupriavidus sp. E
MKRVVLTGATGFLGGALLVRMLREPAFDVTAAVRCRSSALPSSTRQAEVGEIGVDTDWTLAVTGAEVVVHCAGRAHMLRDVVADPLAAFRQVNRDGTLSLARAAAAAGVRRFVFVSTIGVNGAETHERAFRSDDPVAPHSPYAVSKLEAEQGLTSIGAETGMEVVIVRPPLVYGPGAPGNFAAMMKWLAKGLPLPLGAVHNKRSYIALANLVDLLLCTVHHPAAAGRTLLASDGEDLSTTEFLRRTATAMGRRATLLPVPAGLLRLGAAMVGKPELAQRLCGSLQIDLSETREVLAWEPVVSVEEGLRSATKGYVS